MEPTKHSKHVGISAGFVLCTIKYVMCLMIGQTNARESGKQHGLIIFKHIGGRGTKTPEFFAAMRIPLRRWFIIPFRLNRNFHRYSLLGYKMVKSPCSFKYDLIYGKKHM